MFTWTAVLTVVQVNTCLTPCFTKYYRLTARAESKEIIPPCVIAMQDSS